MTEASTSLKAPVKPPLGSSKSSPMIAVRALMKKFGEQEILRGIDLEVATGETLAIIGRSGGGKSVLLKHIVGLMEPDAGESSQKGWYSFSRRRAFRFHDGRRKYRISFARSWRARSEGFAPKGRGDA
jgi:ABC-type glutathione transport system ATPase component